MFSRGKARNRAMAPNYVLAADHRRREIVLAIRGTKGIGDAITITHFLPEPFLDGCVRVKGSGYVVMIRFSQRVDQFMFERKNLVSLSLKAMHCPLLTTYTRILSSFLSQRTYPNRLLVSTCPTLDL